MKVAKLITSGNSCQIWGKWGFFVPKVNSFERLSKSVHFSEIVPNGTLKSE